MEILGNLLKSSINSQFAPLQEEVLDLLSIMSSLIEAEFLPYYKVLMPMMMEILTQAPSTTPEQKQLRAKTITTIGFFVESVAEDETVKESVQNVAMQMVNLMNSGLRNDDP